MKVTGEYRQLIKEIRTRMGLTQEKLASLLGVTFPTINHWEHGITIPSLLALHRIRSLVVELGNDGADLLKTYFDA